MKTIVCSDEAAWLKERDNRVQASEAAAVMRLSPWQSPVDVGLRKLGRVPPLEKTPAMAWGSRLEPVIRAALVEDGHKITYDGPHTIIASEKHPFMGCSLDGVLDGDTILEIKTSSEKPWDDVPMHYQAQVQHQMVVTGMDRAMVACLFGANRLETYIVRAHAGFQQLVIDKERAFWDLIMAGKLPPAESQDDVAALAKSMVVVPKKEITLGAEFIDLHRRRMELVAKKSEIERQLKEIRDDILVRMGDAEIGVVDGTDIRYSAKIVEKGAYEVKATRFRVVNSNKDNKRGKSDAEA